MKITQFGRGVLAGVVSTLVVTVCMGAAIAQLRWTKQQVIPVCPVKGVIGGFEPIYGNAIGNKWDKDQVKPICEVTTGIGGFVPVYGNTIGNNWRREQVKPFVIVAPDGKEFVVGGRL